MIHSGEAVAFNFSNSTAKQVSGEHYDEVSRRIDKKVFHQDREDYLRKNCVFGVALGRALGKRQRPERAIYGGHGEEKKISPPNPMVPIW